MVDLTASLTTIIAALDAREVSARELLDAHLDRIERLDGPINSVITIAPERAVVEAAAIDEVDLARQIGPPTGRNHLHAVIADVRFCAPQ